MGNHAGLYNNEFISFTQVTPSKMIAFALFSKGIYLLKRQALALI